jgi:hypothetical protein
MPLVTAACAPCHTPQGRATRREAGARSMQGPAAAAAAAAARSAMASGTSSNQGWPSAQVAVSRASGAYVSSPDSSDTPAGSPASRGTT